MVALLWLVWSNEEKGVTKEKETANKETNKKVYKVSVHGVLFLPFFNQIKYVQRFRNIVEKHSILGIVGIG